MASGKNWRQCSIADVAPTLGELKALSPPTQALLLLRRLVVRYGGQSFGKMNFNLSGHYEALTYGYPPGEVLSVRDFLLGAPWKWLEAEGLVRDNGEGFFLVTQEGAIAAENGTNFFIDRDIIASVRLLHPDFRDYGSYFRENKLKEAVAAAFGRYENRLNEIRDHSRKQAVKSASGTGLVYALFANKLLKLPHPKLGRTKSDKDAYQKALSGFMSGALGWVRNAYTHEKHQLPELEPGHALELLFVASHLMRLLDLALVRKKSTED